MKKLFLVTLFFSLLPVCAFAETQTVSADGASYTETKYIAIGVPPVEIVKIEYKADANGAYTATTTGTYSGMAAACIHVPGGTAATDSTTDILFTDIVGTEPCGVSMINIDTGDRVEEHPQHGSAFGKWPMYESTYSFDVTGNSVANATGTFYLMIEKKR